MAVSSFFENFVQETDGDGIAGDGGMGRRAWCYSAATRQSLTAFFQHSFDRFLASSAILSHAAKRASDVIRAFRATANRGANALFIESIADADDHPSDPCESNLQAQRYIGSCE